MNGWCISVAGLAMTALLLPGGIPAQLGSPQRLAPPRNIPGKITQVILITTASWNSPSGHLQRFERRSGVWVPVGREVGVMVGSRGLAWGRGINAEVHEGPQKSEGDHRAPAGIFPIGIAFGYLRNPGFSIKVPYKWVTDRDYFVDDSESNDYNKWVTIQPSDINDPKQRWKSFEVMKRPDFLYEIGLVVQQNVNPTVKGRGSAIFFHVWRGPGLPTAGCTSMAREDLKRLIAWLDPEQSPVVVQVPAPNLDLLRASVTK